MAISLRPATPDDATLLLAWRNDAETRAQSRRQQILTWEELIAVPNGTVSRIFVALRDGEPVGTVRLDRREEGCELSWTVAPERRGQGIGAELVAAAIAAAPPGPLLAEIKTGNAASLLLAERAGFQSAGERDGLTLWRMVKAPAF